MACGNSQSGARAPLCLIRYDTERTDAASMEGFLATVVRVHRQHQIPVTLFCTGGALDAREQAFRGFYAEVRDDPLFDIQDHSYTHIGLGYNRGQEVAVLRADYERSFASHERVFGVRPIGISVCGTSGKDGESIPFDATEKSRAEVDMLCDLGMRFINTKLTGHDGACEFTNYAAIGHPEVMGFASGPSDTGWLYRREHAGKPVEDPVAFICGLTKEAAAAGRNFAPILHDWVAWMHGPDKELGHVVRLAETARECGYELRNHRQCYEDKALWQ